MSALLLALILAVPAAGAAVFRGENCAACHEALLKKSPGLDPELLPGRYDAVVVGGGLSGLFAGYRLRDLKVLVLEKEAAAGGHAQVGGWKGLPYPISAAYMPKPSGRLAGVLRELGVTPQKIPGPRNALSIQAKVVFDFWDEGVDALPMRAREKRGLRRLIAELKAIEARGVLDAPGESREGRKLLKTRFSKFLKVYGSTAAFWTDRYCLDVFGAGSKEVSAWAGLYYLYGVLDDSYTWDGGMGRVSEALAGELGPRLLTGATVLEVVSGKDGVRVVFERGGVRHMVLAETAVIAVPPHVARKILKPIPGKIDRALRRIKSSAYAVAIVRFKRPVWTRSYALWSNDTIFTELTFPSWLTGRKKGPQLAVAYLPFGADDEARRRLSRWDDSRLIRRVLNDIERILPGAPESVEGVRVIRWGHAMPVPGPGHFKRIAPLVKGGRRVFFAGEATAYPAIEGAFESAQRAAGQARDALRN
ncbi:MAG: NAD(P)/FAD-dependent oxidoreductase [Elusimicrobiota bacterium]